MSKLDLIKRMIKVREMNVFSQSYLKEFISAYPEHNTDVDLIRNVWHCKSNREDIIIKFESLAQSLKAS